MKKPKLRPVYCRLFEEDVAVIQRLADSKGSSWQVELRVLVRKAVKELAIPILEVNPRKK